jgi:hypothetical protein
VSYRLAEAGPAAEHLKAALSLRGITSFVSHMDSTGRNIAEDVAALSSCQVFVVLGTRNFGEKTDIGFSTYNELEFACDEGKPLYLIKTFDQGDFIEEMTRFRLPKSLPYETWDPATKPNAIVDGIVERLKRLGVRLLVA